MNYESAYLAKLEGIITRMGGVVPAMKTPTNFQERSLELLEALDSQSPIVATADDEPLDPVDGQVWREIGSDGLAIADWIWKDGLWVSPVQQGEGAYQVDNAPFGLPFARGYILPLELTLDARMATAGNEQNYWSIHFKLITANNNGEFFYETVWPIREKSTAGQTIWTHTINQPLPIQNFGVALNIVKAQNGPPAGWNDNTLTLLASMTFRNIRP